MKNEMQLKFIILVIIVSTVHLYYYSPSCVFLLLHQNTSTGIFVNFEAPKFTMRVVLALWVDRASVFFLLWSFTVYWPDVNVNWFWQFARYKRRWEHNLNIDVNQKVYEDVDWTPVNCESVNRIFVGGSEREGCIRYWNFLKTNDMEDKYNRRIIKQM